MPNMSHCRFENTASDLKDCYEHWDDDDISKEEQKARARLLRTAQMIVSDYGDDE